MVEDNESKHDYDGKGLRGALWAAFGVGTAAAAKYVLGDGGLFGGAPQGGTPPWARDMDYERELTKANAEIGQLRAEKYADAVTLAAERRYEDKIDALEKQIAELSASQAVFNANTLSSIGVIKQQTAQLAAMTATVINAPTMLASESAAAGFKASAPAAANSGS